jgi:hypothetical protein
MGLTPRKLRGLLFPATTSYRGADRSIYERFAIPFAFKPRLSFFEAMVAIAATFLRLVLGCLLFAVWGTYSLLVWFNVSSLFLRICILVPLFVVFMLALALMLLAIAAFVKLLLPRSAVILL